MAVSRENVLRVRNFLDNWIPPAMRESKWMMYPLLFLVFKSKWRDFAAFKEHGLTMSPEEYAEVYRRTADVSEIQGVSDLNEACIEAVLDTVKGGTVLEAGCGRGYLAERLAAIADEVTACDIALNPSLTSHKRIVFAEANIEALPYPDDSFDTVVCTHTLEHVQRLDVALAELRRVARERLVIVVPRERPYRYTFNLHLHFFPHPWSWQSVAGAVQGSTLRDLGDWFYVEPIRTAPPELTNPR